MSRNSSRTQLVLFYVERIEAALGEVAEQHEILASKKAVVKEEYEAARTSGLNDKVVKQMIFERKMDAGERRAFLTECELYRAACGDLDGRSLSPHARRAMFPPPPNSESRTEDESQDELPSIPQVPQPPEPTVITSEMIEQARIEGGEARDAGVAITANQYPFDDERRAAWDTGWCQRAGSDGMDIPKAPPRPSKKKDPDSANDDDDGKKAA
jgi:uncharacterized protein (UPF0335 family)